MLPWSRGGGLTDLPANAKLGKMQQIQSDGCNSLGPQRQMFLTKLQCHNRANSWSMCPCTNLARHCKIVGELSKCHSLFQ